MDQEICVKKKTSPLLAVSTLLVFVCLVAVCAISNMFGDKDRASIITPTPRSVTKETAAPPALLPNIQPADVTINLENKGLACAEVNQSQNYYVRTCEKTVGDNSIFVEIYGKQLLSVDFISATVIQPGAVNNQLSTEFLGFVATIPFVNDDGSQEKAKSWVIENVQNPASKTTINGVLFEIEGLETAVTLNIGEIK